MGYLNPNRIRKDLNRTWTGIYKYMNMGEFFKLKKPKFEQTQTKQE